MAVNKLELIDFNSGQHPSAKHSPGSALNKLPPGPALRSALVYKGTSEVKENRSEISTLRAMFHSSKKKTKKKKA